MFYYCLFGLKSLKHGFGLEKVKIFNRKSVIPSSMTINFTDQIRAAKEAKTLNKPFRTPGGPKKFSVYVKNEKGNVVKVNFGDPNMEIKRDDPARRKNFRARHNCANPGPKWKARYWSCYQWRAGAPVKGSEEITISMEADAKKGLWYNIQKKKERLGQNYKPAKPGDKDYPKQDALKKAQAGEEEWDGISFWDQAELLKIWPELSKAEEVEMETEESELEEYKSDFLGMSIGSLRSIQNNVNAILANLENPNIKENLTESWLQGKIAVTEDYMIMIHNYVMFNQEDDYSEASEDEGMENEEDEYENGSMVRNINPSCDHYGSEGVVESVEELPNRMGKVVKYKVTNDGPTYKKGDILTKTKDQLVRSRASYESEQEYQSIYQTEGKNFRQFLQKCIPSKDGSDKEKFQSCLLDYKNGQSTKAKLFQPPLVLNEHNTKLVNETYKAVVIPALEKEHGKRVGAFTEDDMHFQERYEKTVHPDYPVKSPITKDKIFTPEELNKDLQKFPGNSKR